MTEPVGAPASLLEAPCLALIGASAGLLQWEFDPRFRAASAAFPASRQADVRAALEAGFDRAWTSADIASAPPRVGEVASKMGGLRPGQILFGAHTDGDPILLGAWWPWGGGQTISIRVLFSARTLDGAAKQALLADFQGWFGLA